MADAETTEITVADMQVMMDEALMEMDDGLDIMLDYIALMRDRISYLMSKTYTTDKVRSCLLSLNFLVVPIALAITIAYGANNAFNPNSTIQDGLQKLITCFMCVSGFFGLPFYLYTLWDTFVGDNVKVEKAFTFGEDSNFSFYEIGDRNIEQPLENDSHPSLSPAERSSVRLSGLGKRVDGRKIFSKALSSRRSVAKIRSSDSRLSRWTGTVHLDSQDVGDEEIQKNTLGNKDQTTISSNSNPDVEKLQDEVTALLCGDSGEGNVLRKSSTSLDRVGYFDEFCHPYAVKLAVTRTSAKTSSNEGLDAFQEREDTFMEETSAKVPATVSWAKADKSDACKTRYFDEFCHPYAVKLAVTKTSAKTSSNDGLDVFQEREDTFMEDTSAKVPATVSWAKPDKPDACKTGQGDNIARRETGCNVSAKSSWERFSFGM